MHCIQIMSVHILYFYSGILRLSSILSHNKELGVLDYLMLTLVTHKIAVIAIKATCLYGTSP